MQAIQLITDTLVRKFPGAVVAVDATTDGFFTVSVTTTRFRYIRSADRQHMVYTALDCLPPEAVAKISNILCVPELA